MARKPYPSSRTRLHCPLCGSLLFCAGNEVWCSRQGSAERPGCQYGVSKPVTKQEHLTQVNAQKAEANRQQAEIHPEKL